MSEEQEIYPRGIARLLNEKDLDGLTQMLRQPVDAGLRASAAEALSELGDTSVTEYLVRSYLEDPEPLVRAAARLALEQLVGGQAEMAIAVHRSGAVDREEDPWLQETAPSELIDEDKPAYFSGVRRLIADDDTPGLIQLLRNPDFPALRIQAALALAELRKTEATDMLVRATREDPDPEVQAAAQQALIQLFGSQSESILTGYPNEVSDEDPWLVDSGELTDDFDEEPGLQEDELSPADLEGFTRIALYESSEKLRFQAIRVISRSSDMRATETLANLAIWGDNHRLREAAHQALEDRYGEQAEEIIDSYRSAAIEDAENSGRQDEIEAGLFPEDEDDEDLADENRSEDEEVKQPTPRSPSPYATVEPVRSVNPVMEDTGVSWWIILLGVLGLGILAAVLILGRF